MYIFFPLYPYEPAKITFFIYILSTQSFYSIERIPIPPRLDVVIENWDLITLILLRNSWFSSMQKTLNAKTEIHITILEIVNLCINTAFFFYFWKVKGFTKSMYFSIFHLSWEFTHKKERALGRCVMCERSGDNNVPSRNLHYISKVMIA